MIFRLSLLTWVGLLVPGVVFSESTVGDPVASQSAAAKDHYERGEYEDALRLYRNALLERPDSPSLRFNVGDVLFKIEDYEGAMQEYKAALAAADKDLKADTFYNLGNSLFQQQQLEPAIEAYKNSLDAEPGNLDAKANLELAQRFLEQQQQQQQQQQQEGEEKEGDDQDQNEQQGQQNGKKQEGEEEQREESSAAQQEEQGEQESQPQDQSAEESEPKQGELNEAEEQAMDPQEAARIMAALKDREKEMQQRRFRGTAGRGEKDW
jgi:Ca-activated chloride channel family protein